MNLFAYESSDISSKVLDLSKKDDIFLLLHAR